MKTINKLGHRIEMYIPDVDDIEYGGCDNEIKINWASIGSVDLDTAEEFAKAILEAVKEGRNFEHPIQEG